MKQKILIYQNLKRGSDFTVQTPSCYTNAAIFELLCLAVEIANRGEIELCFSEEYGVNDRQVVIDLDGKNVTQIRSNVFSVYAKEMIIEALQKVTDVISQQRRLYQ